MKDPLQKEKTPYEILGVSYSATQNEINDAFKVLFLSKGNLDITLIRDARNKLIDPIERTLIDIFLYEDNFLSKIIPKKLNPDRLEKDREEIAEIWRKIHRETFPNPPISHNLAVLYYWWALNFDSFEQNLQEYFKKKTLILSNFIAYWVYIINSNDFWEEWLKNKKYLNVNYIDAVRKRLITHFDFLFENLIQSAHTINKSADESLYKKCKLDFLMELEAANNFKKNSFYIEGFNGKKVNIEFGIKMMEELNILSVVRKKINKMLELNPNNEVWRELERAVSPFTYIKIILEEKRYDEVISEVENCFSQNKELTSSERMQILKYLAKACLEKGILLFKNNKFEEAFYYWSKGLKTGYFYDEFSEQITKCCKDKINLILGTDIDKAITLLEKALNLVSNSELKRILSNIYVNRGVMKINKVLEQLNREGGFVRLSDVDVEKIIEVKDGIRDLERAVDVDPSNENAKIQLDKAREVLKVMEQMKVFKNSVIGMLERFEKGQKKNKYIGILKIVGLSILLILGVMLTIYLYESFKDGEFSFLIFIFSFLILGGIFLAIIEEYENLKSI